MTRIHRKASLALTVFALAAALALATPGGAQALEGRQTRRAVDDQAGLVGELADRDQVVHEGGADQQHRQQGHGGRGDHRDASEAP